MKLLTSVLVLLFGLQSVIAQQPTQLFKIKVKDEDNLNLPGASISITPGKNSGTTNQAGEISFIDLKQIDNNIGY